MSRVAGPLRVAATVRNGDIVRLDDGSEHTVVGTPTPALGGGGALTLTIRFADGAAPLRVNAGAQLDVVRPE